MLKPKSLLASQELASFAALLEAQMIPQEVFRKAEDLFVDWVGSTLAGKGARAVEIVNRYTKHMGPGSGAAEVLIDRTSTSPYFAAMVNAAASHVVEQDDVHNASVFHPATVVFSPALAVAQSIQASGKDFLVACIAGYEVGIRVGEFLGRSHYKVFHTTGTAGTIAAAAAVGAAAAAGGVAAATAAGAAACVVACER
jgi:2-methylcitrate dehydratase PrpD